MKESQTIDQLLWKVAVNDDEKAFQTLFFDFFSPLCVFAHKFIDSWEACEDVVQDTFLKIWQNRKSLEIKTSARNFLLTSVRNASIDYLRKKKLEMQWKEKELQNCLSYELNDLYSCTELERMLNTALEKLPDNIREVFEMNRFEGKTYKEIAEEKAISIKTVEAQMSKALKTLRMELNDYLPFLLLFVNLD